MANKPVSVQEVRKIIDGANAAAAKANDAILTTLEKIPMGKNPEESMQSMTRLMTHMTHTIVLTYWEMGNRIAQFTQGEHQEKYGRKFVINLAKKLEMTTENLYKMRRFHEKYDRKYMLALVAKGMRWTQLSLLSDVEDTAVRKSLTESTVAEGLTTRALKVEIEKAVGKPKKTGSKDKDAAPVVKKAKDNPVGFFTDVKDKLEGWLKELQAFKTEKVEHLAFLDNEAKCTPEVFKAAMVQMSECAVRARAATRLLEEYPKEYEEFK